MQFIVVFDSRRQTPGQQFQNWYRVSQCSAGFLLHPTQPAFRQWSSSHSKYNEKYYFIRNVCYTDEGKLKCSVDFYDRETLNRIKQVIPQEKSFIEPTDYIKYNINPDLTYDITFEDYDLLMLDASDEDIICAISKISYDLKVRTKNSGGDLPFEI